MNFLHFALPRSSAGRPAPAARDVTELRQPGPAQACDDFTLLWVRVAKEPQCAVSESERWCSHGSLSAGISATSLPGGHLTCTFSYAEVPSAQAWSQPVTSLAQLAAPRARGACVPLIRSKVRDRRITAFPPVGRVRL